ncbi:fibroblast growth factor receptor 4-like isoform X1 [Montipora capricornis]|uniref:fibroblast growth factor receptor 4-like isoform X1 n=1 Tax=Montipora capricornis TaxID=246305 RepID=UPI0035F16FD5
MMVTFYCFECGIAWRILFLITCCLSLLRFLSCQICGEVPHNSAPSVKITTSPTVDALVYGSSLNLTCTARVTRKSLPYKEKYNAPCEIEWWLTGGKMVHRCKLKVCLHASSVMNCTITLGGSYNELNSSGNFTCKASNGNNQCTRQKIEIKPLFVSGLQTPEITPVNQSARIGSNVTFLCTVGGHPRPVMSWFRTANNSDTFNESNSRIRIKTNVKRGQSHLIIAEITKHDYGIYFCSAKNILGEQVSNPAVLWQTTGLQKPETTPLNQSARIGSNVTFLCTVGGHPRPVISWFRTANNSDTFNESNSRIRIKTNVKRGQSHLIIAEITKHDYGIYFCSAKNILGEQVSNPAVLWQTTVAKPTEYSVKSPRVMPIVFICIFGTLGIGSVVYFLWYRKLRRRIAEAQERDNTADRQTPSDDQDWIRLEKKETSDNIYDSIDSTLASPLVAQRAVGRENVPLLGGVGSNQLDMPRRDLPPIPNGHIPPRRPPKPNKKEQAEEQLRCVCIHNSNESAESNDNLLIHQETAANSERRSIHLPKCPDIEENWRIDFQRLRVFEDEKLGEGAFGIVRKGKYRAKNGQILDVAVKQLKDTAGVSDDSDLLNEIKIFKQAGQHPNIVNFVGECTKSDKILLVTELVHGKSLEAFLKSKKNEFPDNQPRKYENVRFGLSDRHLLEIALQIALGMKHLQEKKCIHRDLAARNVFIDHNHVAKLGDFGLARDISKDGIYTQTSNDRVPWRWLSLESLKDHSYTYCSDVWSFGIVLWEIAAYGEQPYPFIETPCDLKTYLSQGERMSSPKHCCKKMYKLMSSCWDETPSERPTFAAIAEKLKSYLEKVHKIDYVNTRHGEGILSEAEHKWHLRVFYK